MKTSKKMKSFIKGFVAYVTGDDSTAQAEKTLRLADAALNTHIHIIRGELIGLEQSLDDAEERAAKAIINHGKAIEDRDDYVRGIINADNDITTAVEKLSMKQEVLQLLEEKLEEINTEV